MSLINNMLKDLEQRSQGNQQKKDLKLVTTKSASVPGNPYKNLILILTVIALGAMLAYSFNLSKWKVMASPFNPPKQHANQLPTPSDSVENHQMLLKNIVINIGTETATFIFKLNNQAYYTVDYNSIYNKYVVNLHDTQLSTELPIIQKNNILKSISFKKDRDILSINFDNQPHTVLQSIDETTEAGDTLLTIIFSNTNSVKEIVPARSQQPGNTKQMKAAKAIPVNVKTPSKQGKLHEQYLSVMIDLEKGRMNSAQKKLHTILILDPEYHDARATYIALLLKKKDSKAALQELNNGLKLNPDYIPFIELKARLLASENKFNTALVLLKTVSPEIKDNNDYYSLLAMLYEKLDMNQLAAQTYKKLLGTNQHNGNWWLGFAVALEKLGHSNAAADAYRHALTEDDLNTETIAYVQNQLNTIEGLQ